MQIDDIVPIAIKIPPASEGPFSSWAAEVGQQIIVRIGTHEGLVGWGGCFAYRSPRLVFEAVEHLATAIVGHDPTDLVHLCSILDCQVAALPREALWAAAGIELAAWDILGKSRGLPVSQLLGRDDQVLRAHIPVYASLPRYETPADVVDAAVDCLHRGFSAIKLHQTDIVSVAAARAAVGKETQLMLDVNCAWDAEHAIAMAKRLEPYGLRWLEEPVAPSSDHQTIARVRKQSSIPIACGENDLLKNSFCDALQVGAADIYQPSILKVGGIANMRQIAAQIVADGRELAPHSYYFGPGLAASLHFASACEAVTTLEIPNVKLQADVAPLDIHKGTAVVPTAPGLGVDPDPILLDRYSIPKESLDHW